MKKAISFVLVLVMLIGLLPRLSMTPAAEAVDPAELGLAGKKISILGDSISTMVGVSNNTDYNSTIGGNHLYYYGTNNGVTQADTWWQQAIDTLGMELCVDNAWSGSCVFDPTPKASTAYMDRCVQLHNDHTGAEPDIIAIYLGTNDISKNKDAIGSAADIDYDTLIVEGANGYTYADPNTMAEAYAIMLHKISQRYPNAEVYCFTVTHKNTVNDPIRDVASYFGTNIVDLYQNSGIVVNKKYDAYYIVDGHPNALGMDAITGCFLSSIYENSRYVNTDTYSVTYNLSNVKVDQGNAYAVPAGSAFACSLTATNDAYPEVTVTMGGKDITATCYAEGKINIPYVTGDVAIQAKVHNHNYTVVVTPPTCADEGYTTSTCGCGYVKVDQYVDATEAHVFENGICTSCGLEGYVVHKQGNVKAYYKTLEEAAAKADGGNLMLLADLSAGAVVLKPGVTLNLNGYTLTADMVFAMNGAIVTDGIFCTGGGFLKIAKGNLALSNDNGGVIPVWNGNDGYVFTKVTFQQMAKPVDKTAAQYIFLPAFSNAQAVALLADGGLDNSVKLKVSLTWNNGQTQQFYTYSDALLAKVVASGGRLAFSLNITGIADISDMVASAVVVTDSGAQAAASETNIIVVNILDNLNREQGFADLMESGL